MKSVVSKISFLKITAIFMLAISLVVIPTVDFINFSNPAIAAAKKKGKKKKTTKKSAKKKNIKQKTSSKKSTSFYRCRRCGELWVKGAAPEVDFVYQLSQCKYGGMHVWRRIK